MNSEKELFIIRHGETDLNLLGVVQGRGVNPSLNETGRTQAMLFYNRYRYERFDVIYTSSLTRTHESVQHFVADGIPWEKHVELDEISWGIFEGKHTSPAFKYTYRELMESWSRGYFDEKAPDGESPNEVQERQKRFLNYFIDQPHRKSLVCMHGRAMRIFLPTLLQQSLHNMDQYPHHNLTLYKLVYRNQQFSIELFNNMDHLHNHEKS